MHSKSKPQTLAELGASARSVELREEGKAAVPRVLERSEQLRAGLLPDPVLYQERVDRARDHNVRRVDFQCP